MNLPEQLKICYQEDKWVFMKIQLVNVLKIVVYQYLLDGPIIIKYIVHIDEILDYMLDLFIIEMLLNIFITSLVIIVKNQGIYYIFKQIYLTYFLGSFGYIIED